MGVCNRELKILFSPSWPCGQKLRVGWPSVKVGWNSCNVELSMLQKLLAAHAFQVSPKVLPFQRCTLQDH